MEGAEGGSVCLSVCAALHSVGSVAFQSGPGLNLQT